MFEEELFKTVGLKPYNTEYNFWTAFFDQIDQNLKRQFEIEVKTENSHGSTCISWDFWLGGGGSKHDQYIRALERAEDLLSNCYGDWKAQDVQAIWHRAQAVRNKRNSQLIRDNTDLFYRHLGMLDLWIAICQAAENYYNRQRDRAD